jgi:hypothetical protein
MATAAMFSTTPQSSLSPPQFHDMYSPPSFYVKRTQKNSRPSTLIKATFITEKYASVFFLFFCSDQRRGLQGGVGESRESYRFQKLEDIEIPRLIEDP